MFEEECVHIYILQVTAGSDESPDNTLFFSITVIVLHTNSKEEQINQRRRDFSYRT